MSTVTANMAMPLLSALPEEELRLIREYCNNKLGATPEPVKKHSVKEDLHAISDQIGDFYRPGKEEEAISEIMFS